MASQPPPLPPAPPHFPAGYFVLFIVALLLLIVIVGQIQQMTAQPRRQHASSTKQAIANAGISNDLRIDAANNQMSGPTRPNEWHAQIEGMGSGTTITLPTRESARPDELCREEWTKRGELDERMYRYCMNGEREGRDNLIAIAKKYQSMDWFKGALDYTVLQWTKRGMRSDKMVAYSLGKIADAFEDLQYESKQPSFDARKYSHCHAHWTFRFDMVRYCYKQD